MYFSLFLLKLNSSSLVAHNHEQLERAHSICLASHQRIIAAIEFPLAAHELLCSPHIFVRDGMEIVTNAKTVPQLVPIEFKSGPSYMKHTIEACTRWKTKRHIGIVFCQGDSYNVPEEILVNKYCTKACCWWLSVRHSILYWGDLSWLSNNIFFSIPDNQKAGLCSFNLWQSFCSHCTPYHSA